MVLPKEILSDYMEIHDKAEKLVNEESKNDPITEPYRSHYEARDLLIELKRSLKNAIVSVEAEDSDIYADDILTYVVMLSYVCRSLGRIYTFIEESSTGEKILEEVLLLLKDNENDPKTIIPYIGALNELGIIYANRSDYTKAYNTLNNAERCYEEFRKTGMKPLTLTDICGSPEDVEDDKGEKELDNLYTLCCFYLAQVFCNLKDLQKSAHYCHLTLKRQWEAKSYDPIDFAINAATLSQYFINENMFNEARHHLAAANLVMSEYEKKLINPVQEISAEQFESMKETYMRSYADIARCWAKYGLALLSTSRERLYNDDENLLIDTKSTQLNNTSHYLFPNMPLHMYEKEVTKDYCLTFRDAKGIYHFVCKSLNESKEYYTAETRASEYAKIIQDFAELYEYMAFFEDDPVNQTKMQKRRAKYYEELINLLNPTYYMNICRSCWYGAGLAYCAILDIKLDDLVSNISPSPQVTQKINYACQNGIKHFQSYIDSYKSPDGKLKMDIDIDDQKVLLTAHFHLGRLYFKIITPDVNLQLENLSNSLKIYKDFLDKCEEFKEVAQLLKAEIGVCRDMVKLLPMKICNVSKRMSN